MTPLNKESARIAEDEEAWRLYSALAATGRAGPADHLNGALAAHRLGRLYSAYSAIQEATACGPTGELKGQVRFLRGNVLRDIGHLSAAIAEFSAWIAELNEYPALAATYLGAAHYNLGLALRRAERYTESIHQYELACDEFRRRDRPTYLCMALYNLAWVACRAGRADIAAAALKEVEPHSNVAPFVWHHRLTAAFLEAISEGGDLRRVMELCSAIIQSGDSEIPPSITSHAYWLSGRVALELGLMDTAQAMVEQAMLHGARSGDANRCMGDAEQLLREIRERRHVDLEMPPTD